MAPTLLAAWILGAPLALLLIFGSFVADLMRDRPLGPVGYLWEFGIAFGWLFLGVAGGAIALARLLLKE